MKWSGTFLIWPWKSVGNPRNACYAQSTLWEELLTLTLRSTCRGSIYSMKHYMSEAMIAYHLGSVATDNNRISFVIPMLYLDTYSWYILRNKLVFICTRLLINILFITNLHLEKKKSIELRVTILFKSHIINYNYLLLFNK